MTPAAAQTVALKGLAYLVNSGEPMDRFMALSGAGPAELRDRAGDPEFLAAILDFLMSDEALLVTFCEDASIDPKELQTARQALPGA